MPATVDKTIEVSSRPEWRKWLATHHASCTEVWLIFHKRRTVVRSFCYLEAVQEALCFGWIDSLVQRLDDDRYARKFTPRKADSRWSSINRRRYESLKLRGLLAAPGLDRPPTDRSGDAPRPASVPAYIEERLKSNPPAWQFFERLAPSHRRAYTGWIDSAKREETKERRLREAIGMLAAGQKPGLK